MFHHFNHERTAGPHCEEQVQGPSQAKTPLPQEDNIYAKYYCSELFLEDPYARLRKAAAAEVIEISDSDSDQSNPNLISGDTYIIRNPITHKWVRASFVAAAGDVLTFIIQCRGTPRVTVDISCVAFQDPPSEPIAIGSRILAKRNRRLSTGVGHALGAVAETPAPFNRNRYLILFDDVSWQYVNPKLVHSLLGGENLPDRTKQTLNCYLSGRFLDTFELTQGDCFTVLNGATQWVLKVDASLVLLLDTATNVCKWTPRRCPALLEPPQHDGVPANFS